MLRETEVDGVQTLLAPSDGPLHAGLTFRVGRADETLARAGITHLLEHLALFRHGLGDYHYNGATGVVVTHFHLAGSPADVVSFFDELCTGLSDPPFERLATEKAVLRTEEAGNRQPAVAAMAMWRYGARGYGLVGYDELGLPAVTADDLTEWSRTWFTRQNAVLWISADEVPAGLRLRLPEGARRPTPPPSSALPQTPAYFVGPPGGVAFDAVVRRGPAAMLYARVLEREMFRSLRREGGYSYTVCANYEPRDGDYATLVATADALPDHQDAVLGGLVDVLAKMRHGRIAQADLDSVRNQGYEALRNSAREAARLPAAALNALTGAPNQAVDELLAELSGVTLDDLRAVAVEAHTTGLLMAPREAGWAGFAAAPTHSTDTVTGFPCPSRDDPDERLIVAADGVSVAGDNCRPVTVRFASCVAALSYPDGGRHLIGDDGIVVSVEPTLYQIDPNTVARIDAALPAGVNVPMPARTPEQIPRPRPPAPPVVRRRSPAQRVIVGATATMALLFALCTGCGVLTSVTADPNLPEEAALRSASYYLMIVVTFVLTVGAVGLSWLFWSRPRQGEPVQQ